MNFLDKIKEILIYSADSPLLFTQLYFWVFFALVMLGYSILYKKRALRNTYLFVFSLFFYYKSGGYFFSLLIFSTLVDYALGILISKTEKKIFRYTYLILSITTNIGLLAYFKYTYFFIDIINQAFTTTYEAKNFLAFASNSMFGTYFDIDNIILPVGISFYTFQTISYSVDVFRKKVAPVKNIIDFGFYVSFFPQLVAGPIVRAAEFIPQLYQEYKVTYQTMGHAVFLIISGLVKKVFISDFISMNYVDRVFESPISYSGFENLMATYGYSIQIYCDFSGYTDIAIGVALLFGFRLPINFNSPYKAINISDFWRRWHISLSSWLRDYLYIPLGGNKKGKIRSYINLIITMLLGGLWHGANLRFVIWGLLHGFSLVFHKLWILIFKPKTQLSGFKKFIAILFTFHTVSFSWIFFRASDLETANLMFEQIFNHFMIELIPEMIISYKTIYSVIILALILHWLPARWKEVSRGYFIKSNYFVKIFIVVIIVFILYQMKSSDIQPFIYFQF